MRFGSALAVASAAGQACEGAEPLPGSPTRLLHVFTSFNTGGAQVRFTSLAEAFGPAFSHTVLALTGDYEASARVAPAVDIHYLDPPSLAAAPIRLLRYRALIERLRPHLLLTYNWGAMEFALANLGRRTPHLHHEDGFGPEEADRQLRRRVWLRRLALGWSHVLVPSHTLRDLAERDWRLAATRLHHIPNGIAAAPSSCPKRRTQRPTIAWVGALRPEKNVLRMVDAFASLKDRATLLIVGDGSDRPALEARIRAGGLQGSVELLGRRSDARDIIRSSDVLALSSDTEQMPLVVLEAMDAARPVASVDVGDVRRMVAPENSPFVTPIGPHALTRALSELLADAGLRRRIGEANRRRVLSAYRHDTMVEQHRRLVEQLAARPTRS